MPTLEPSIYSVLVWLSAILIASLDLVIFLGSRSLSSRVFAASSFLFAVWATSHGFLMSFVEPTFPLFLIKIQHVVGIAISAGFFFFSLVYPGDKKPRHIIILFLAVIVAVFAFLFLGTDLMIIEMLSVGGVERWGWKWGSNLHFLFDISFGGLWIATLINVYKKLKKATTSADKVNLRYMFYALIIGIIPPGLFDVYLPSLGYYKLGWVGPISGMIWWFPIAYSILKYRQMNVRAVLAEALVIGMTVIFFINIFTGFSFGIISRIATFAIFLLLGTFLIRNILKVSIQSEQLKDLNDNLQKKVDEQTAEIQRAYEIEKRARIELQQLNQNKNDFIIITQHHLRTPLAQIRWYANSITSGLYGAVSSALNEAVRRIDKASEKLIKTLNNFLGVVQMKIGVKFLTIETLTLKPIIEGLLDEYANEIKKKNITVVFPEHDSAWPPVRADAERIKDALAILLDNAVQYNQESGSITFETKREGNRFILRLSNTGLGIWKEDAARLFTQSFFRTKDAKRVNPTGMGVGLLVVKTIIEAHKGTIECLAVKDGLTTFEITLPMSG